MAGEIRYSPFDQPEFGFQELEFRIAVNNGFRELDPNNPADQGVSLTGGTLAQDIIDISETNTSLKQENFALTEGEGVQLFIGLFDPVREQFLDFSQIDRLTNLDIDALSFEMNLRMTGFSGDSELVAGDVALLSESELSRQQRDAAITFSSEEPNALGSRNFETVLTAGEFAVEKRDTPDLDEGKRPGDYEGSITSNGVSQITPIEALSEASPFPGFASVFGIPTLSIQTVFDGQDVGSSLIDPNANTAEEQQTIRLFLDVTYQLNGDDTIFTTGVSGDFNYIDLAAGTAPGGGGGGGGDLFFGGTEGPDLLQGGAGDETIIGLGGNDTILGGDGDDQLSGIGGKDKLNGGAGNDSLFGDGGKDRLIGGAGDDVLGGGGGKDLLKGGGGDDNLEGGRGKDRLKGGGGDDTLFGDRGNDTHTGNGGADTFFFLGFSGKDVITDFNAADDGFLFGAGGSVADLGLRQRGSTLEISYLKEKILVRNTDQDEFLSAEIRFDDLL